MRVAKGKRELAEDSVVLKCKPDFEALLKLMPIWMDRSSIIDAFQKRPGLRPDDYPALTEKEKEDRLEMMGAINEL